MAETEGNINDTLNWALALATRRRWWIILPAACIALASTALLPYLPKRYRSEATLVVVQQQVSPLYVTPPTMVSASDAVRSLTREVLSRPRLLRIIEELGLYPVAKRTDGLADVLREEIEVEPLDRNDYSAFKLSFSAATPHLAQAVTSRLASLFIEENLRSRGEQAEKTATFLSSELENAKQKLAQQEERLKDFKLRNLGKLPQEQQVNLAALTALRAQLLNTMDNLARARRLRESLESLLSSNLARLVAERSELLKTLTPQHRAVLSKDQEITRTKGLLDRLRGTQSAQGPSMGVASDDIAFAQLRTQAETNAGEIASLSIDEQRLKTEIARYQNQLNMTPVTEAQLSAILRDHEQHTRDYSELLHKRLQSQLTASLEERQQGQHFRLVDPPTLPLDPSSPNRQKILLGALAAGLGLGLAIAFLREMRDRSFHEEKDLAKTCALPLVVGIPLLLTPHEEHLGRRKRALEWLAACFIALVVVASEVYAFRFG